MKIIKIEQIYKNYQKLSGIVDGSKLLIDRNKKKIDEIMNGMKDKDIKDKED